MKRARATPAYSEDIHDVPAAAEGSDRKTAAERPPVHVVRRRLIRVKPLERRDVHRLVETQAVRDAVRSLADRSSERRASSLNFSSL